MYQKHWSFEPPVKIALPAKASNPIDAFILDRLKREGLTLSPEADRPTLIRRVSFALTGLPPGSWRSRCVIADKSTDAYEKMVDRYLASKHYGEEMARHWLDLARYADTHGLHLDNERQMWLYRDWVVQAFNDNLGFDRFTIGADSPAICCPRGTSDQDHRDRLRRCNVSDEREGGSIDARVDLPQRGRSQHATTWRVYLELTGGCAVCLMPSSTRSRRKTYRSMYAFFYSIPTARRWTAIRC